MNNNDAFLKQHNIKIIDTNKRWSRMRPVHYNFFEDDQDYNSIMSHASTQWETERLLTIEIPESDLTAIQDFEEQVFNNMKQHGAEHYRMFDVMMEQKEKEKYLRNRYSAVKKAYEQYSLMLKLAETGGMDNA